MIAAATGMDGLYYRTISTWPIALAALIRLAVWFLIPDSRFASDEDSYFHVATALLHGRQDLFWPPVTGWLIALVRLISGSDSIAVIRLAWAVMDVACAAMIYVLAARLGRALWDGNDRRVPGLAGAATIAYAIYLPAIGYSQFATSEIPALAGTLLILVLVTAPRPSLLKAAAAGLFAGLLCLTRPSLLPLIGLIPLSLLRTHQKRALSRAALIVVLGVTVVAAYVMRNWLYAGEFTISTNSAYNLFIGNRDMYAEDLDLFNPRATAAQIEFRRQQFSGQLPPFTQSPADSQRLAIEWIREHPGLFARRALGRLARVFVPKTDVLELLGGEVRAGIFAPASLALLAVTNVQWTLVLFGGLAGVAALRHRAPDWAALFIAVIVGAVLLCTIAISKPRYSFVFDPLLIIAGCALWLDRARASFSGVDRRVLAVVFAFIVWGWIAFAIFAVTSRSAI